MTACAGVIEAVGSGVISVRSGDRVYVGGSVTGTCAEMVIGVDTNHRLRIRKAKVNGRNAFKMLIKYDFGKTNDNYNTII